ncbi:hypothetical protein BH790_gp35 [Gordonia phage Gsput1]|uniref:Uncharacterized protein n=1 Tax=Gordonia phage Gsput1 TaxID=1622193 RepID=A0A0E3T8A4_9CAUD|nr:hypothetical protein BH790_gp35 [Gordonia phage Gsput1]AKC03060.1 hypothetical protein Gsput1_35 [Gordonia phage Gsput1]
MVEELERDSVRDHLRYVWQDVKYLGESLLLLAESTFAHYSGPRRFERDA